MTTNTFAKTSYSSTNGTTWIPAKSSEDAFDDYIQQIYEDDEFIMSAYNELKMRLKLRKQLDGEKEVE